MRVLITGAPKTGKSTLARSLGAVRYCTDPAGTVVEPELGVTYVPDEHGEWSAASQYVADHLLTQPGPWVIEGVAVPRALRKWRAAHPDAPPPADRLIVLHQLWQPLRSGQLAMGRGVHRVLAEMEEWLAAIREDWTEPVRGGVHGHTFA